MREVLETSAWLEDNLDDRFIQLSGLFDDWESAHVKVSDMLDSGRWKGVAAEQCRDMQKLLVAYEQDIRALVNSFKGNCFQMLDSIDTFGTESLLVPKLKRW